MMKKLFLILVTCISAAGTFAQSDSGYVGKVTLALAKNNKSNCELSKRNSVVSLRQDSLFKKGLWSIDVGFFVVSYARRIKNSKWYIGGGLGLYGSYYLLENEINNAYDFHDKEKMPLFEFVSVSIQSNYVFSKNFILRSGITAQQIYSGNDDSIEGWVYSGLFISPLIGIKRFKIGTRIIFGGLIAGNFKYRYAYYNPIVFVSCNL